MGRGGISLAVLVVALALGSPVAAQTMDYGKSGTGADDAADVDATGVDAPKPKSGHERVKITPYIEALQIMSADLSPDHDVVTWSALAVGADAHIAGRNSEASASIRYERRFGWGRAESSDTLSGLVRGSFSVVPRTLTIDAGALATRTAVDASGASFPGSFDRGSSTHLYSVYAGPNLSTHAGDVAINAHYHIGYTEVGTDGGAFASDVFDHSVTHNAEVHAGVKPGDVLPIGVSAGAGYYQEDISNLDQRVTDAHARLDVTVPISMELAAVGGVGYEKVEVSGRDAVRDVNGLPVVGADGRYVTDISSPRQIAYESSGLIWDAGIVWRPSRRTALEAHVGWRYGSTTYYGSFGWRPNPRSSFNVSVYDAISGVGGRIDEALASLPTDFEVVRDPVSGDITGCVATLAKGGCLTGALGSLRSATFRARGVMASYAHELGRFTAGVGAGYDHRRFIAAPGTILAAANGVTDENTWLSAWFGGKLDRVSGFNTTIYVDWYRTGFVANSDSTAIGATASYNRIFGDRLTGTAALSLQGVDRQNAEDSWAASALLGMRYSF